jgi:peptide deformylase
MHIYKNTEEGNILNEDLTGVVTEASEVSHMFKELTTLCKVSNGLGVAANQLGIRANFFFAAVGAKFEGKTTGHICINPSWKPHPAAEQVDIFGEGCLSLPGELYAVKRWTSVLATWTNTQGHVRKDVKLTRTAAQVFQHEHDHLRGITLRESGQRLQISPEEAFSK